MTKPKQKVSFTPEERTERILRRLIAAAEARDNLLAFARFMRSDPADVDDATKTTWETARHHRAIAGALTNVEQGAQKRLILTMQPRAGKTTLTSHLFVPWFLGRHPEKSVIVATYNDTFAGDHGRKIRDLMLTTQYRQVFPDVDIRNSSVASIQTLVTPQGGQAFFVGRGTAINGRGGDILIADDILKDGAEASSTTIRNDVWNWWNETFINRRMNDQAAVILCMTRWHSDDPIGRITDPVNDFYQREEAEQWNILNLPALAMLNDPLGRELGEPLWPERFSKESLEKRQRADPRGFESLFQGSPTRASGNLINEGWLKSYEPRELPKMEDMRIFLGTDFALSSKSGLPP